MDLRERAVIDGKGYSLVQTKVNEDLSGDLH